MAETATIDLISFNSANIDTATKSVNKSYADKSASFANVLDSANKSYSYERNTAQQTTTQQTSFASQQEKNQDVKTIQSKKESNKESSSSKKAEESTQDSNTKINDRKDEQTSHKIEDKPEEKIKEKDKETDKNTDSKNTDQNNTAKNDKNELNNDNQSGTKAETSNTKQDSTQQDKADNAKSEIAQTISDAVLEKVQDIQNLNQTPNAEQNSIPSENNKTELANQNSETKKDIAQVATSIKNEVKDITEQLKPEKSEQTPVAPAEQTKEEKPVAKATEEIDLNVAISTDNVLSAVINTQTSDDQSKIAPKAMAANQDLAADTAIKAKTQNANTEVKSNIQTSVNTANTQISATVGANQQILETSDTASEQQIKQSIPASPDMQQTATEQNTKQAPVVQAATDELTNTAVKNKIGLGDTQNNPTEKTLSQKVLDGTNAEIVSVKTSDTNADTNQKGMKNNQNTEDQLVKLSLETEDSSTNVSTTSNSTNTQNLGGKFSELITDATGQTTFSKGINNSTQTQTLAQTAPREIKDSEILSQINNKMTFLKEEGTSKINIILRPENLGKINLELVNSKEGLTAQLTTNNSQVKEILDKSLDSLKENLSSQGINVNNVSVKVEEAQKQSNDMNSFMGQFGQNQQQTPENASHTREGKNSFDENINNSTNIEQDAGTEQEEIVSTATHDGKVDYKI